MVHIRPIRPEEIEKTRALYQAQCPWAAEPNWTGVFVRVENDEITGFIDLQLRILVSHLCAIDARTAIELIAWTDGKLGQAGYTQYEFNVPDQNKKFQHFIEKHYGLEGHRELPGLTYLVTHSKE